MDPERFAAELVKQHRSLFAYWGGVGEDRLKRLEGVLGEKQAGGAPVWLAGVLDLVRKSAEGIASTPAELHQVIDEEGLPRAVEVHFAFADSVRKLDAVEKLLGLTE